MKNHLFKFSFFFMVTLTALSLQSCTTTGSKKPTNKQIIAEALSAAPSTFKDSATVMSWDGKVLKKGTSNYTCFPSPPTTTGKAPMCFDKPWMSWGNAWQNKKNPDISSLGISYMLIGDGGASNTDPYAKGPTDDNQWIVEGPHLMIVVPDTGMLDSISTNPKNGGPYVMWKGTPYAHVMVPLGE